MARFGETIVEGYQTRFEGTLVASEQSAFQQIEIYETPRFGRVLVLDGLLQTSERDEFCYHEMLVHVPLLSHPNPRSVLVVGGGDGGTLRRVLEHPGVERAVMCEIDERVTRLCREHLPSVAGDAFDDARAEVRFADGIAFVRDAGERFDAIIVDSSDPVGPGVGLFTGDFYRAARDRLNEGGLVCAQSGSPLFQQGEMHQAAAAMREAFASAQAFLGHVPLYPGTLWSFLLAAAEPITDHEQSAARAAERKLQTRYWSPAVQAGAFALPQLVSDVVAGDGPPWTWGRSPEWDRHAVPGG